MTIAEAKRLIPGVYELRFTNGQTDLGIVGIDINGPWYAHVNGAGAYDGPKSWKFVSSACTAIRSNPKLPE